MDLLRIGIALAIGLMACNADGGDATTAAGTGDGSATNGGGSEASEGATLTDGTSAPGSASATATMTATVGSATGESTGNDASGDTTGSAGALPYEESFEGADGSPWPAPWHAIGNNVLSNELTGGRARLSGATSAVARMALPGFVETDTEVTVTVVFDEWYQQGFGFYVRQNGGALQETDPPGQGYAVFSEGGFEGGIGLWRELDGVEERIAFSPQNGIEAGVAYRVRFQCFQDGDVTTLRAKMWPVDQVEPGAWQVQTQDSTPVLQGTSGSFAADVYNYAGTGSIYLDDLRIDAFAG